MSSCALPMDCRLDGYPGVSDSVNILDRYKGCRGCGARYPAWESFCGCGYDIAGAEVEGDTPHVPHGVPGAGVSSVEGEAEDTGASAHATSGVDWGYDRYRLCSPPCSHHNAVDEYVCVKCGSDIAAAEVKNIETSVSARVTAESPSARVSPAGIACAFEDCGATNPVGTSNCIYCDRPLVSPGSRRPVTDSRRSGTSARDTAPFRVCGADCQDRRELAIALALCWQEGVRAMERGDVLQWLRDELRDAEMAAVASALVDDAKLTPDLRLLHLIYRLDPETPPVWKGHVVSTDGLESLAQTAAADNGGEARELLDEIYLNRVLEVFPDASLADLNRRWRQSVTDYADAWNAVIGAGGPRQLRPTTAEALPRLLEMLLRREAVERLRATVRESATIEARACPWFQVLGPVSSASGPRLLVQALIVPLAAQAGTGIQELRAHCTCPGTPHNVELVARCRDILYDIHGGIAVVGRRVSLSWGAPGASRVLLRPFVGRVGEIGERDLPAPLGQATEFCLRTQWSGRVRCDCVLRVEVPDHRIRHNTLVDFDSAPLRDVIACGKRALTLPGGEGMVRPDDALLARPSASKLLATASDRLVSVPLSAMAVDPSLLVAPRPPAPYRWRGYGG